MKIEIDDREFLKSVENLLFKQLDFFLITKVDIEEIKLYINESLNRSIHCFSFSKNKYYRNREHVSFNIFHSGQWCIFIYFLSNTIFRKSMNRLLCDKIYYLNRMLNGVDLFYEVNLPSIFFLDHPLGSVIGRAEFGDFFSFSQGCTVGNNKGIFPIIGKNVKMLSNSKIIGNCNIGDNVLIAANAYVKDIDIPEKSIVFGSSPNLIIKENKLSLL
jgi:serine O-acetyltransferase